MNPAFTYVYDECTYEARHERTMAELEAALSLRGMEGRVARLSLFRSAREFAEDIERFGSKNVIFVGTDLTLSSALEYLMDVPVTVGFVPLEEPTMIGQTLGIPVGVAAVDVLAARYVECLDVGLADDKPFFCEIVVPRGDARMEIEGKYRISPAIKGAMSIRNLCGCSNDAAMMANAKDGLLEVVIQAEVQEGSWLLRKKSLSETRLTCSWGRLVSEKPTTVVIDGRASTDLPIVIGIKPAALHMITGRGRLRPREEVA